MTGRGWVARSALLALPLLCPLAWGQPAASVEGSNPKPAATPHDAAERCHRHATVDACDDAIRWNPRDPTLLVAMGDAQLAAKHPADAVRAYQRAATLAPATPGLQEKITKAGATLTKSKSFGHTTVTAAAGPKRFSNADPETQSH